MLPENDTQATRLEQYSNQDLERFIQEQESRLAGRKLIAEGLLFLGCQTLSSALAIFLFQFAVRVWITYLVIWAISLAPAMSDLCNIHFDHLDGGWKITIMRSPIKTVVKLIFGAGITAVGIWEVRDLLTDTANGINNVFMEIQRYEQPKSGNYDIMQLKPMPALFLASAIVFLVLYLKEKK